MFSYTGETNYGASGTVYFRTALVKRREAEDIRRALSGHGDMRDGDVITNTVAFPDGTEMDISVVGCRNGAPWTEAALFDKEGREVAESEPGEEYFGLWSFEYGANMYVANVVPETPPITKERIVEGIEKNLVRFAPEPGAAHGTACHIGGNYFWFGGSMAEEEDPEQYLADVPMEDVVDKVHEALSSLRLWMETAGTYARCDAFLRENGV